MARADSAEDSDGSVTPDAADPRPDDDYECKICYNVFDLDRRSPKVLSCSHTFCQECLDTLHAREGRGWRVGCPVCRHRTPVPDYQVRNISTDTSLTEALRRLQPEADTETHTETGVSSSSLRDGRDPCKHVAFALSCVCAIFSLLAMVVLLFLGLIFVHNFSDVVTPIGPVCLFAAGVLALFSLILSWLICMLKHQQEAHASGFSSLASNVM